MHAGVPQNPRPNKPFDIIQPVIQYGPSFGGGGDYWTLGSWYVTLTNDVVVSELVQVGVGALDSSLRGSDGRAQVQKGDSIFGNMTMTADDTW